MRYVNKQERVILTESQGGSLLELAREAIECGLGLTPPPQAPPGAPANVSPVFVTLRSRGELRGCMGTLATDSPLPQAVIECATAAAFRDPRFQPLEARELEGLQIEVSLLGSFRPVQGPQDIEIGKDGLLIEHGSARGLLLPHVAIEFQADQEQFLEMVCRKAGLPEDAWKSATLQAFAVQVFTDSQRHEDLLESR